MVEIKINIEKRHVWLLALLVLAVGVVIAQGTPGVSHSAAEVTGLNAAIDARVSAASYCRSSGLNCPSANQANCAWLQGHVWGASFDAVCPANQFLAGVRVSNTKYSGGVREIYCCDLWHTILP